MLLLTKHLAYWWEGLELEHKAAHEDSSSAQSQEVQFTGAGSGGEWRGPRCTVNLSACSTGTCTASSELTVDVSAFTCYQADFRSLPHSRYTWKPLQVRVWV